jgi:hypothetical protein
MFINAKDAPFAVTSATALYGIVRAFEDYPRAAPATVALCGVGVGLAVGSRVLGGFTVLDAVLPLPLIVAIRGHDIGPGKAFAECGPFILAFVPGVILAYLVMGLVWPWSVVAPLNPFHAVEYFSNFFEKPWRELFDGRLIPVPDMPRGYVPTLVALKLPEILLALGGCGIGGAIVAVASRKQGGNVGRRAALLAVLLAATLPVLVTIATRPAMYNGIRHFVFVVPPFAVLGGLAAAWIARRLEHHCRAALIAGALVLLLGVASPVADMMRLHPYEYTHFNRIGGGAAGARPRFMLDYWGLSLTQASRQLLALIDERGERPSGEKWTVAVCGPHPPVTVALGPQFITTWNPKGADFAMMLGEFYCAKLDAPVLFEVVRDGVVFARVYDIRGHSIATLLTVPGIDQQ